MYETQTLIRDYVAQETFHEESSCGILQVFITQCADTLASHVPSFCRYSGSTRSKGISEFSTGG